MNIHQVKKKLSTRIRQSQMIGTALAYGLSTALKGDGILADGDYCETEQELSDIIEKKSR